MKERRSTKIESAGRDKKKEKIKGLRLERRYLGLYKYKMGRRIKMGQKNPATKLFKGLQQYLSFIRDIWFHNYIILTSQFVTENMIWNYYVQLNNTCPAFLPVYLPANPPLIQSFPSFSLELLEQTAKRKPILNLTAEDLTEAGYESNKKSWTEEEDQKLLRLRGDENLDWASISAQLPERNAKMCYSRYRRLENHAKESWKKAQNQKLLMLVEQHGQNWKFISQHFEKRTHKQLKEHYLNYLRPEIKKEEWTLEEDLKLVELLNRYGKEWKIIERNFEGRTQNQIKNRYFGRLKKLGQKRGSGKADRRKKPTVD